MGWFSRKKSCDWCGTTFSGDGISDGGMVFCGQDCIEQKNAPPIIAKPAAAAAAVAVTPESIVSDLQAACACFDECIQDYRMMTQSQDNFQAQELGGQLAMHESDAWRNLGDAAQGLRKLGGEARYFDVLFAQYLNRPQFVPNAAYINQMRMEFDEACRVLNQLLQQVVSRG